MAEAKDVWNKTPFNCSVSDFFSNGLRLASLRTVEQQKLLLGVGSHAELWSDNVRQIPSDVQYALFGRVADFAVWQFGSRTSWCHIPILQYGQERVIQDIGVSVASIGGKFHHCRAPQ